MPDLSLSEPSRDLAAPEPSRDVSQTPVPAESPNHDLEPDIVASLDDVLSSQLTLLYGDEWRGAADLLSDAAEHDPAGAYARLSSAPETYGEVVGDASQADRVSRTLIAREQVFSDTRARMESSSDAPEVLQQEKRNRDVEPRWGQLATANEIVLVIREGLSGHDLQNLSFREQAAVLRDHFEANKRLKYNEETNGFDEPVLKDGQPLVDVDRYVYTTGEGWIDMHHLFYFAYERGGGIEGRLRDPIVQGMSRGSEAIQAAKGSLSGFSYEDLPSNRLGMEFAEQYGNQIDHRTVSMENAMAHFLADRGAVAPEEAPNFEYIPYAINQTPPLNYSSRPLPSETLRREHQRGFESRSEEEQAQIREAHRQIPR